MHSSRLRMCAGTRLAYATLQSRWGADGRSTVSAAWWYAANNTQWLLPPPCITQCPGSGPDCPPDSYQPSTVMCRATAGECDVPEFCSNSSPFCPPDAFKDTTTECRPAKSTCDNAEKCSGEHGSMLQRAKRGQSCLTPSRAVAPQACQQHAQTTSFSHRL